MQEETTQRTIALAVKTGKLTEEVLKKVMMMYLNERGHPRDELHGKISVRKLMGINRSIKMMDRVRKQRLEKQLRHQP